jgi:hypothetical protein
MQTVLDIFTFIASHLTEIVTAVAALFLAIIAVLHALIAIFLFIPGEQPEKALQSVADFIQKWVDFISKFSAKKQ